MTKDEYAARRAGSLCIYSTSCPKKVHRAGLCRGHYSARLEIGRRSAKKFYDAAKAAGLCTRRGCGEKASDDCNLCPFHKQESKKWNVASPARAAAGRRLRRKWLRQGKCTACGNEPLLTKRHGERCRQKAHDRDRAKRAAERLAAGRAPTKRCHNCLELGCHAGICERAEHPDAKAWVRNKLLARRKASRERRAISLRGALKITHCSLCGEPRCRANYCPKRPKEVEPPRYEDFALARNGNAMEAA